MEMTIYCGKCGKKLSVDTKLAGKTTECSRCHTEIPVPSSNFDEPQIRLFCFGCGARVRATLDQSGGDMRCPKCKQLIPLPVIEDEQGKKPAKVRAGSQRAKPSGKGLLDLEPEIEKELEKLEVKKERKRPSPPGKPGKPRKKPWELTRDVTAEVAPIDLDIAGRRRTIAVVAIVVVAIIVIMACLWFFVIRKRLATTGGKSTRPARTAPAKPSTPRRSR